MFDVTYYVNTNLKENTREIELSYPRPKMYAQQNYTLLINVQWA